MDNTRNFADPPPIGLMPEHLFEESKNDERVRDLIEAMLRCKSSGKVIPEEWKEEFARRAWNK